jgi:hypothetical protein
MNFFIPRFVRLNIDRPMTAQAKFKPFLTIIHDLTVTQIL